MIKHYKNQPSGWFFSAVYNFAIMDLFVVEDTDGQNTLNVEKRLIYLEYFNWY